MSDTFPPNDPNDPTLPPTEAMPTAAGATPPVDPNAAIPGQVQPKWTDNKAAVGTVIGVGLALLVLLIGGLIWWAADDDDQSLVIDTSTTIEASTTTASIVSVEPLPTVASTAVPTTAPETTAPPTTAPVETTPPSSTTSTSTSTTTTSIPVVQVPPAPGATVFDIIEASPDLSRLRQLIIDADLVAELDGAGPLTLFAPSNQAIETLAAAPGGAELLADPVRLRELLLRHVILQSLDGAGVFAVTELPTANNQVLIIDAQNSTVDGAKVVVADVSGANGFLHVVDQVLIER